MLERHVGSLPQAERRQVRSQSPYRAAEIYLSGLMGSKGLHAAAVSDRSGLPLLGVGTKTSTKISRPPRLSVHPAYHVADPSDNEELERYYSTFLAAAGHVRLKNQSLEFAFGENV